MGLQRYRIFGLCVETEFPFRTPLVPERDRAPVDLRFTCRPAERGAACRPPGPLLYASSDTNRYDESSLQLFDAGERLLLRFPRVADFHIPMAPGGGPQEIVCRLYAPEYEYMVEIYLLGDVLACYLELMGMSAVHASAVAVTVGARPATECSASGQALLFSADRGGGKSTLTASLLCAGFALLSDDIAALEIKGDAVICRPSYPQLKLNREQALRFAGTAEGFPRVHPGFDKLSVLSNALGPFCDSPLAVARIYLLERKAKAEGMPRCEPVSPGEALVQLARSSFLAEMLEPAPEDNPCGDHGGSDGRADNDRRDRAAKAGCGEGLGRAVRAARFQRLGAIVRSVPMRRLVYATGYEMLPGVHEAVRADLGGSVR